MSEWPQQREGYGPNQLPPCGRGEDDAARQNRIIHISAILHLIWEDIVAERLTRLDSKHHRVQIIHNPTDVRLGILNALVVNGRSNLLQAELQQKTGLQVADLFAPVLEEVQLDRGDEAFRGLRRQLDGHGLGALRCGQTKAAASA